MLRLSTCLLSGSVGGPKWGVGPVRPEQGLLKLRKELGLYANIRPANFASESLLRHSPLKEEVAKGFDMVVVREVSRSSVPVLTSTVDFARARGLSC